MNILQKQILSNIKKDISNIKYSEKKLNDEMFYQDQYGNNLEGISTSFAHLFRDSKALLSTLEASSEAFSCKGVEDSTKEDKNAYFEVLEGNIGHLVLSELLPMKVYYMHDALYGVGETTIRKYVRPSIKEAFEKYIQEKGIVKYKEKVVIYIRHNYEENVKMRDNDNMELKQTIDDIATYLLVDDSPQFCSIYTDSRRGEKTFSEIFIIPQRIFSIDLCQTLKAT